MLSALLTAVMIVVATLMTGCGGGGTPAGAVSETAPAKDAQAPQTLTPASAMVNEWIEMIDEAGFCDYAQLGREMLQQGRVIIVSPTTLGDNFNAFAHINTREIWLNTPLFERYPDVLDQATIFLHELIHIHSGEATHNGPWWSHQDEFRVYYRNLETHANAQFECEFCATEICMRE